MDTWAGRRVLLTGGTGFVGQHLTRRLVQLGVELTVALGPDEVPALVDALPPEAERCQGDVRDEGAVGELFRAAQPEFVFHLAAVGVTEPFIAEETALAVNLYGTLNLLRAATQAGVRRLVVAGTSYEYGERSAVGQLDPGNVYAASKVAAWAFCRMFYRAYGAPVVVVRPFNIYGPGQSQRALIPAAIRAACSHTDFETTPGEQRRDFIYIDDVIEGLIAAAVAPEIEGESLDLGTGLATPVRQVVERVFALAASDGHPRIGALPYRPGVVWDLVANAERTAQLTGWRAKTDLSQGLRATIEALAAT
jgi:nucleoside-diphosphate-sugar epimerase